MGKADDEKACPNKNNCLIIRKKQGSGGKVCLRFGESRLGFGPACLPFFSLGFFSGSFLGSSIGA
jgi:hypothetical protein